MDLHCSQCVWCSASWVAWEQNCDSRLTICHLVSLVLQGCKLHLNLDSIFLFAAMLAVARDGRRGWNQSCVQSTSVFPISPTLIKRECCSAYNQLLLLCYQWYMQLSQEHIWATCTFTSNHNLADSHLYRISTVTLIRTWMWNKCRIHPTVHHFTYTKLICDLNPNQLLNPRTTKKQI